MMTFACLATVAAVLGQCPPSVMVVEGSPWGIEAGHSVAVRGVWAVVGAPLESSHGSSAGAAFVWRHVGGQWQHVQTLWAPDAAPQAYFGFSAALDDERMVIGAPFDNANGPDSGSAYVFRRTGETWAFEQKLAPPTHSPDAWFGFSVALEGGRIATGAPVRLYPPDLPGAVHVYERSGESWTHDAKLNAPQPKADDQFGFAVALEGDILLIGAPNDDAIAPLAGAAHVYSREPTGWIVAQTLRASDGAQADLFGRAAALAGGVAFIGAPHADTPAVNAGKAYVFTPGEGGWTESACLTAPIPVANDGFGWAIASAGSRLLVGTPRAHLAPGAAHVFRRLDAAWWHVQRIDAPPNVGNTGWFGAAVGADGELALIGARRSDEACPGENCNAGAAYAYTLHECGCAADLNGDGAVNSLDFILFLIAYVGQSLDADWNGDGQINSLDFIAYLGDYTAGCA
ncbi:MAG: hypothetical protein KIS87_14665 [Phycisphaeraceae bacterium]|nr:hypothetical protein [Phycisphaeraceae bacterium]